MFYFRLLLGLLTLATIPYYIICLLQLSGFIKFTQKTIKFPILLIPFFYLFGIKDDGNANEAQVEPQDE